ncbi:hypothetical protein LXA43DRAFT_1068599 [Ganoderma leucocontextum]|nr:hypothetical protein LXA43DRAFT_1068599 [Ganoderma leucocontextum]
MASTSFTAHQRTLSDEEREVVEKLLTTSISPDSSFNSVSMIDPNEEDDEGSDEETVAKALALPDYDDFDVAAIIHEEPDIDNLQIEHHVFDPDAFPRPEPDATICDESGRKILPFPLVTSNTDQATQVVKSPQLYFRQIIAPYINNSSIIQLLADEPEDVSTPTTDTSMVNGAPKRKHQRPRRLRDLQQKLQTGVKHPATVVTTATSFPVLPKTQGEWKGSDFRHRPDHVGLRSEWRARTIGKRMADKRFLKVPYEGHPTWLVDEDGIAYAFRTEQVAWMLKPWVGSKTFIQVLNDECAEYIRLCGDNSKEAIKRNHRGPHWASVPGVDRQSKCAPFWTKFHLDHLAATLWLLGKDTATRHLIDFVASTFALRFPMLAARVRACERKLLALGCDPKIAKPLFGLWYNYCINGARPHASVEGVSCEPHTDAQNLAIMMCALFIYGDFDWEEKAWLVLWEAGVIIQLPIGVVFYYPSALFIHFNINIFDFHHYVFTTKTGEPPTPETLLPIHGAKGRGSIVFFNQASLFQYAELGSPVAEAAKRGMPTAADNEPYMTRMPMFTKQ